MEVKAIARDIRISPYKVRFVVDLVRGKKVDDALNILKYASTPAARAVAKIVKSAAANAENNYQMSPSELRVVRIYADEARSLKRFRAQARGRANQILKRASHITVFVDEQEG
jgi:large subunit ribosomal protein L22